MTVDGNDVCLASGSPEEMQYVALNLRMPSQDQAPFSAAEHTAIVSMANDTLATAISAAARELCTTANTPCHTSPLKQGGATERSAATFQYARGLACNSTYDYCKAFSHFAAAVVIDPGNLEAQTELGLVAHRLELHHHGATAFERASKLDPTNANLLHYLGLSRFNISEYALAAEAHRREQELLEGAAASPDVVAESLVAQADAIRWAPVDSSSGAAGAAKAAISIYQEVLALVPGHKEATFQIKFLESRLYWHMAAACFEDADTVEVLRPYRTITLPPEAGGSVRETPLHSVYCCKLAAEEECRAVVAAAEAASGWSSTRHKEYPTRDLEVSEHPVLRNWLGPQLHNILLPTMSALFEVGMERLAVREVFLVKYSAAPGEQKSLPLHRDGYDLSFNILLCDPDTFDGGGTVLKSLETTVQLESVGDVFLHCGQMLHGGGEVTWGTRYIMVGFVEIVGPSHRDWAAALASEYADDSSESDASSDDGGSEDGVAEEGDSELTLAGPPLFGPEPDPRLSSSQFVTETQP